MTSPTHCDHLNGRLPLQDASWTDRRVLVTGAGGFVGNWLVRDLAARGASVIALIRPAASGQKRTLLWPEKGVQVIHGSVTDLAPVSQLVADLKVEIIYHLAASNVNTGAAVSPYDVYETNTRGVYTILEAARLSPRPVRAVIASSREVEDCFAPASPRKFHPYMTSKAAAELMTRAYADTYGLSAAVVRSDNIYGGGDFNWNRLIPGAIQSILQGRTPVIRGDGLICRDYLYVEDVVAAYLAIGLRLADPESRGKLFRIATGTGSSVLETVKEVMRAAGLENIMPQVLNQKSESRIDAPYQPVFELETLGWQSRYSLREGLKRTWAWYRDHFQDQPPAKMS